MDKQKIENKRSPGQCGSVGASLSNQTVVGLIPSQSKPKWWVLIPGRAHMGGNQLMLLSN